LRAKILPKLLEPIFVRFIYNLPMEDDLEKLLELRFVKNVSEPSARLAESLAAGGAMRLLDSADETLGST
jgi:hypothetical protein